MPLFLFKTSDSVFIFNLKQILSHMRYVRLKKDVDSKYFVMKNFPNLISILELYHCFMKQKQVGRNLSANVAIRITSID